MIYEPQHYFFMTIAINLSEKDTRCRVFTDNEPMKTVDIKEKVGTVIIAERYIPARFFTGRESYLLEYFKGRHKHYEDHYHHSELRYNYDGNKLVYAEREALYHVGQEPTKLTPLAAYTTLHPCFDRTELLYNAGIRLVIYLNPAVDISHIDHFEKLGMTFTQIDKDVLPRKLDNK